MQTNQERDLMHGLSCVLWKNFRREHQKIESIHEVDFKKHLCKISLCFNAAYP